MLKLANTKDANNLQMRNNVGSSSHLVISNQIMNGWDSKLSENLENNISVKKDIGTWINEMDKLCIKVLSNARLRNFVSVNENGSLFWQILAYLKLFHNRKTAYLYHCLFHYSFC
ncbi:unnamed protein product [Brugia timori]|uniref:Uncharacterized protein n=1 Tax=Brugia timori TaxID=42155 RepID=A0A0R3QFQ3_9BILA|nr:unnamed protein product [Brugia timori]